MKDIFSDVYSNRLILISWPFHDGKNFDKEDPILTFYNTNFHDNFSFHFRFHRFPEVCSPVQILSSSWPTYRAQTFSEISKYTS